MSRPAIPPKAVVRGPFLPEPVEVILTLPIGDSLKLVSRGLKTGMSYDPILSPGQLAELQISPEREPLDGDPDRFKLEVEAARLALVYEYDPFFSLSVARIDPLPHQLEAVYEYFMKPPPPPPPAKGLIWEGQVPPQKWMNFYTRVLARFATQPDLKLRVRFEVAEGVSPQKVDETRVALRELGLDESGLQAVEGE